MLSALLLHPLCVSASLADNVDLESLIIHTVLGASTLYESSDVCRQIIVVAVVYMRTTNSVSLDQGHNKYFI